MIKPVARSRAISSPTTLLFSSDRRRKGCLTGFASDRTCSLCSANSIGAPGMSLGGPCEDVPILTEEIDELAFLFAVKVCTYDSVPLWVLWVQRYLLRFLCWLERSFSFRLLRVG